METWSDLANTGRSDLLDRDARRALARYYRTYDDRYVTMPSE